MKKNLHCIHNKLAELVSYSLFIICSLFILTNASAQTPQAPTDFITVPQGSSLQLNWVDHADNESGFIITKTWEDVVEYRQTIDLPVNTETYSDSNVKPGIQYNYSLFAYNSFGASDEVTTSGIITVPGPPAPADVSAMTGPMTSIEISFTDNSDLESWYEIRHSEDPNATDFYGNETVAGTGLNNVVTHYISDGPFNPFDPSPDKQYYHPSTTVYIKVRAVINDNGTLIYGSFSPVVSATTNPVPATPTNFNAVIEGSDVHLSWEDNSINEAAFFIVKFEGEFSLDDPLIKLPAGTTEYTDTGVESNIRYHYWIVGADQIELSTPRPDLVWPNMFTHTTRVAKTSVLLLELPPAPTDVVAAGTSPYSVLVNFTDVSDLERWYEVVVGTSDEPSSSIGSFEVSGAETGSVVEIEIQDLSPGTNYYFWVRGVTEIEGTLEAGAFSTPIAASTFAKPEFAFEAPIITEVVGSSPQTIQVKLIDTNSTEAGYIFYWGTSPESLFESQNIESGSPLDSGQVLVYNTNSGYEANTTVYVQVAAYGWHPEFGEQIGPLSEVASATTLAAWPPSPSNFEAVAEGEIIRLTWTDNSPPGHPFDEAEWGVMRGEDGTNFSRAYTVPANTTTFIDDDVTPGTRYTYRLESINDFGLSFDVYYAEVTALPVIERPTVSSTDIHFSDLIATSMSISFTPGNGSHRLAVARAGAPPTFLPGDNYKYSADLGDGQWVVSNTQDSIISLTGLQPATKYFIKIFEYNTDGVSTSYLLENAALASSRTAYGTTTLQLFGMASEGGDFGAGTIFKIGLDGKGLDVLHHFNHLDGEHPYGSLIQTADGSLFGMTSLGGTSQYPHGLIFKIKPDGTGFTVVREFREPIGDVPLGSLIQTKDGFLMGTTYAGGPSNYGTIFKMRTDGSDYTAIHNFSGSDGYIPRCTLLQGADGTLYGLTPWGGTSDFGTIFKINTDGTGFKVLHNFSREIPQGSLIQAPDGTLLGMATEGGLYGSGIIFRIDPDGSNYRTLFDFNDFNGRFPTGTLTLGEDNVLYGTTDAGGPFFENGAVQGGGTIFKINIDGTGHTILHSFVEPTGLSPAGGSLILHENKLYGYTFAGGTHNGGVIFNYDLSSSTYNKLADLSNASGKGPAYGSLLLINAEQTDEGVQNFSLINSSTTEKILDFNDSITLDIGDPDYRHWTIRANTSPDEVGSVVFKIDVQKKNTENKAPYLLAGHHLRALSPTPHILEAEAYSQRLGRGNRLQSMTALIRYINNTTVNALTVLDAEGETVQQLNDGDVLNAGNPLLRNFNIEALLNRESDPGSVQFYVNGELFWTENRAPYIMVTGNRKWWTTPGLYTVTAIPYSGRNGSGLPGVPRTVTFTISDTANDSPAIARLATDSLTANGRIQGTISVYPVPAQDVLYLLPDAGFDEQDVLITIHDAYGETRFKKLIKLTPQPYMLRFAEMGLKNGMYYLQMNMGKTNQTIRFIKE